VQNSQLIQEIQIRQQTEAALHQAVEQAEAANRTKSPRAIEIAAKQTKSAYAD
jgi:hypothetical protein